MVTRNIYFHYKNKQLHNLKIEKCKLQNANFKFCNSQFALCNLQKKWSSRSAD